MYQAPESDQPAILTKDELMQSSNNLRFKKFEPRADDPINNAGLSYGEDFSFNP